MTDFFETRVKNLEPKADKKSSAASKKPKKSHKKRKRENSNSSVVESSKESTEGCHPSKKYWILHRKCSHATNNCKDLHAIVNKHKQKRRRVSGIMERATRAKYSNWVKFQKFMKNKKKRKTEKELQHFLEMQIFDDESKKSVSSLAECIESGEISSSSSEWKIGSDELFVTCFNCDSENKIEKTFKNYLDLFINTSLNQMSIRSCLISQPNINLNSNSEQLFNTMDLSPITFGVISPLKLRRKISTNSQNNPGTPDENQNSKVSTLIILLDSGASASIICKDVL